MITNAHHTSPVNPSIVAKYVPNMMVQISGMNTIMSMNSINPITPIPSNNSSIIIVSPLFLCMRSILLL